MIQPILYCTDIHYGAKPVSRKDDYNLAILRKFEYCLKMAKKFEAVLLVGGDLFDRPTQQYYDIIRLVDVLKRYPMVRIIVNRGNQSHDGHPENSPLTLLNQTGLIETSDDRDYVDLAGVRIIFAPNSEDPMSKDCHINKHSENYLMTHHMIVDKPLVFDYFLMEDFVTECSLVFCADYHPSQGIQKVNNIVFVAPGSIARRKMTKDNVEKEPSCVLLTDTGFKVIKIPYEKDVWVEKIDKEKLQETEVDMGDIQDQLSSAEETLSLETAWQQYAIKQKLDSEVVTYINKRLFGVNGVEPK